MPPTLGTIASLQLFDGLEPTELGRLAPFFAQRTFTRGDQIAAPESGQPPTWILTAGAVRLVRSSADGRLVGVGLLEDGAIFGQLPYSLPIEGERAEALSDCRILEISSVNLERIAAQHPLVAANIVRELAGRLATSQERLAGLAFQSVPARLATLLLELADRYGRMTPQGVRIDLRLTHGQLSELVSTTRETLTKVAGWLTNEQLVTLGRREIWIRDGDRLEQVARGELQMPGRGVRSLNAA